MFGTIVTNIVGPIAEILKKIIPDADARAQAQEEITKVVLTNEAAIMTAARDVIVAEINSGSYAARNWRPHFMYFLMFLIMWIAIIAPLIGVSTASIGSLKGVPAEVWQLMMIGMGGYVIGRTGEKIAESLSGRFTKQRAD